MKKIIEIIKEDPRLKRIVLWMLQPAYRPRPRLWVRMLLNPIIHKKGKGSLIRSQSRMDVFPFNKFEIGDYSTIEDYSCVNNAMGNVVIGSKSRIGLGNTIIGPVKIGNNVNIAQNVVISGLNHGFEDITIPPREQKCSISKIEIEDDCWIGANVVVTSGVKIGKHSIVAAGSIVTKDILPFSVVAGNPARVIKQYDFNIQKWTKNEMIKKNKKNVWQNMTS
ncbi:MAG: acyltransferase [Flavobacteriales bacterium]|nr:acyltransferase [Flavobacteriales bacterium]